MLSRLPLLLILLLATPLARAANPATSPSQRLAIPDEPDWNAAEEWAAANRFDHTTALLDIRRSDCQRTDIAASFTQR